MNRFDLQHYVVNRSINQTCNDKSKIGLPSVNITLLHYAMTTSTLVDLQVSTATSQDAEKTILQGVTGRFRQLHVALR